MGIIGTVLGLVHVLQNLAAPSTLGPSISAAFIATLMGVGSANVIFLPIANRLKAISAEEMELRMMTLEGILSIQAGDNPRLVSEKLMSYLPPAERDAGRASTTWRGSTSRPRRPEMARGPDAAAVAAAAQHEESNERWLLTYADMITLLMALFMVLFSISSVNISKYETLQKSLKAAFSGNILPGGKAIAQQGATANAAQAPPASNCRRSSRSPPKAPSSAAEQHAARRQRSSAAPRSASVGRASRTAAAAQNQAAEFAHIKRELDAYAASHGFAKSVQTTIEPRGLVIRVLTDDLLFASGQGDARRPRATRCSSEIAQLLNVDETHPIDVEGNTDNVPIHSGEFPSNWELSTARASTVVRFLIAHGVSASRLTATGNAEQRPVAQQRAPPPGARATGASRS